MNARFFKGLFAAAALALVLAASAQEPRKVRLKIDSRAYVERAVSLIEAGEYSLARTYLAPALIDYRLSRGERSRAYYLRGYSHFAQGAYVSAVRDYNRALEFNGENPAALAALGNLHDTGRGTALRPDLAFGLFLKAATLGHVASQAEVGTAYLEGRGVERDLNQARSWLTDAANQGNAVAMEALGYSYRPRATDAPDPAAAARWFEAAAQAGNPGGLTGLAYLHLDGDIDAADTGRAIELLEQAAEEGDAAALNRLGHLYLNGNGVARDPVTARELFERANDPPFPPAALMLGYLYETGLGVEADPTQARRHYEFAAARHHLDAQLRLYRLLWQEESLAARREALQWLARAAERGPPGVMNDYAWLLATTPEPDLRDGGRALVYARAAVAEAPTAAFLDTLAAAHAEAGEFDEAVSVQQRAIEELPAYIADASAAAEAPAGPAAAAAPTPVDLGGERWQRLRAGFEERLAAYRRGEAWRE